MLGPDIKIFTWGMPTHEKYEKATKHLKETTKKQADATLKAARAPWVSEQF